MSIFGKIKVHPSSKLNDNHIIVELVKVIQWVDVNSLDRNFFFKVRFKPVNIFVSNRSSRSANLCLSVCLFSSFVRLFVHLFVCPVLFCLQSSHLKLKEHLESIQRVLRSLREYLEHL